MRLKIITNPKARWCLLQKISVQETNLMKKREFLLWIRRHEWMLQWTLCFSFFPSRVIKRTFWVYFAFAFVWQKISCWILIFFLHWRRNFFAVFLHHWTASNLKKTLSVTSKGNIERNQFTIDLRLKFFSI